MRNLKFRALAVLSVAMALPGIPTSDAADGAAPSVLVVFDGSGSMWGKLDGDKGPKFYAVREALRRNLPQLPPDASLGLMSFGHRRKGDCSDVELIAPPESRDLDRLMQPLEKLNPKGKGPLVVAMREAAKGLAGRRNASIILIHDGPDNCQQDACAAAAEIAKSQPGLPIHTIAIALEPEDAKKTACVAAATGGRSFEPRDLDELDTAVADAVKLANLDPGNSTKAAKPAPAAAAAPKLVAAPLPTATLDVPGLNLTASLAADGPPVTVPVRWRVFKGQGDGPPVLDVSASQLTEPMARGTYTVEARLGLATARQTIEVGDKPSTATRMSLNAGVITPSARAVKDGDIMIGTTYSIHDAKSSSSAGSQRSLWIGRSGGADVVLPAGTYSVRAEAGNVVKEEVATLTPGTRKAIDFALSCGRLHVTVALTDDGPAIDNAVVIVAEDDTDAPGGRREVGRSAAPRPEFVLPAGTYYVTARYGAAQVRQRVAVGAGDIVKRTIGLGMSRLILTTSIDDRLQSKSPATALLSRVVRLDDGNEADRSTVVNPVFLLPQGRYRVEAQLGMQNVRTERTIDVKSSDPSLLNMPLDGGQVTLKLPDGAGLAIDPFWEIRDGSGRVVWRTTQSEAKIILAPGKYVARVDLRDRKFERAFEVRTGDQATIAMGQQ